MTNRERLIEYIKDISGADKIKLDQSYLHHCDGFICKNPTMKGLTCCETCPFNGFWEREVQECTKS